MLDKVKVSIMPAIEQLELELFDIEYVKEGNDNFLRIYLDKPGGIDLNMIVDASKEISEILDKIDPIEDEYFLEVSSPGAERPLKNEEQLKDAVGEYVRIELIDPKAGMDALEGTLIKFEDNVAIIEYMDKTRKKEFAIDYENIRLARLAIKF
ncbi:MAG: ribosome maturation factor RimP [Erysipelotrichales bacterium]